MKLQSLLEFYFNCIEGFFIYGILPTFILFLVITLFAKKIKFHKNTNINSAFITCFLALRDVSVTIFFVIIVIVFIIFFKIISPVENFNLKILNAIVENYIKKDKTREDIPFPNKYIVKIEDKKIYLKLPLKETNNIIRNDIIQETGSSSYDNLLVYLFDYLPEENKKEVFEYIRNSSKDDNIINLNFINLHFFSKFN